MTEKLNTDYQARRVSDAVRTFEREKTRLYRPDGSPQYSEPAMQERLEALQATLDDEVNVVDKLVAEERDRIKQEETILDRDPLYGLEADQLSRVAGLSGFIEADIASQDADSLLSAIDAAVAAGDKASLALYQRHAARWIAQNRDASVTGQLNETQANRFRLLDTVRRKAGEALVDAKAERRRERLQAEREALKPITDAIRKARGEDREAIRDRYLAQAGVTS